MNTPFWVPINSAYQPIHVLAHVENVYPVHMASIHRSLFMAVGCVGCPESYSSLHLEGRAGIGGVWGHLWLQQSWAMVAGSCRWPLVVRNRENVKHPRLCNKPPAPNVSSADTEILLQSTGMTHLGKSAKSMREIK